jgi:acetyltransferase-like isoleucine patch superfamily enzyme
MNNPKIEAEILEIGVNVFIDPSVIIRGITGKAKKIRIGDNTFLGKNVQVICDHFEIGDYGKIQNNTTIHGYSPCIIGHNAWIGQFTIIDSIGGVQIGDNCGIGAHSQLWSHIKYGDTLEGCRFNSKKSLTIGNDVWFVGHCIVSPIKAKDKSMAFAGSVVTSDMEENEIYAGTPAKSISKKVGNQFINVNLNEKYKLMNRYLTEFSFGDKSNLKIVLGHDEVDFKDQETTFFCVESRKYTKRLSGNEVAFMKFLLPERAKFTPYT